MWSIPFAKSILLKIITQGQNLTERGGKQVKRSLEITPDAIIDADSIY